MIASRESVSIFGLMVEHITVNGTKASSTVQVSTLFQKKMVVLKLRKELGQMEKDKNGSKT